MPVRDLVLDSTERTVEWAHEHLELGYADIARSLGANRRTIHRWLNRESTPSRRYRNRMEKMRELRFLLEQVFEDWDDALEWMYTPAPMLGGRTPISVMEEGELDEVVGVLAGFQSGAHA